MAVWGRRRGILGSPSWLLPVVDGVFLTFHPVSCWSVPGRLNSSCTHRSWHMDTPERASSRRVCQASRGGPRCLCGLGGSVGPRGPPSLHLTGQGFPRGGALVLTSPARPTRATHMLLRWGHCGPEQAGSHDQPLQSGQHWTSSVGTLLLY